MIPPKLRNEIAGDPFMKRCIYERSDAPNHDCSGRITWEHAFIYGGRQIQEKWSIVPCCEAHNSGVSMDKEFNQFVAINRATDKDFKKYPKFNWEQNQKYLNKKYAQS